MPNAVAMVSYSANSLFTADQLYERVRYNALACYHKARVQSYTTFIADSRSLQEVYRKPYQDRMISANTAQACGRQHDHPGGSVEIVVVGVHYFFVDVWCLV